MQSEEQRLIDGLFGRLKEAETKTGQRDLQAEQLINQHIREQPSAPYYMAQAMIIQEAALKQLDQRVKDLENQIAQQQNSASQQSSGGFLAGLFGGGSRNTPSPRDQYQAQQQNNAAWNNQPQAGYAPQQPQQAPQQAAAPSRAGGFLGGALQTAAGVAGGVVLADMLTGMFRHSQPQEIVNIIDETPAQPVDDSAMREFDASNNLDTFNNGDSRFLNQDNGFQNAGYQTDDSADFADDDYSDDDSFI
ncbi:hypothetical protein HL670_04264 [Serratia plymuthica]|uniref:DUF2076 domain-containing protein n=1 Tax=Serratia plymuthica TaxID=82996 RepID=UPI00034C05D8|nr:DUF2076 domain-containing protein [Serratia plymuthica]QJW57355.1 hypothetical protein HL670_04264 [Serratia plymuthica]